MSNKDLVFRIGPLEGRTGNFFLYRVFPGNSDVNTFPAIDDDAGLLRITEEYDTSDLVCEPQMEAAAARFGIQTEPIDQSSALVLALEALDRVPGAPIEAIREEALVFSFLQAAKAFVDADNRDIILRRGRVTAAFTGADLDTTATIDLDATSKDRILFTFDDRSILLRYGGQGPADTAIQFGVEFADVPHFAVDAVSRGFGLHCLPIPILQSDHCAGKVNDTIMLLLIPLMTALAHFRTASDGAYGEYEFRDKKVECNILARSDP